jgi:hypothetical protein
MEDAEAKGLQTVWSGESLSAAGEPAVSVMAARNPRPDVASRYVTEKMGVYYLEGSQDQWRRRMQISNVRAGMHTSIIS